MQSIYIGLDLGTSSVKAIAADRSGNILCCYTREYDIIREKPGYAEQNMNILWEASVSVLQGVSAFLRQQKRMEDVKGISFSGQMHGLVLLDEQGELLRNAIIWADQRSTSQIEKIYQITGKEAFLKTTGNQLAAGFYAASLFWIRENEPENYDRIYKAVLPKDYIRYRLCNIIMTDESDASSTGIFDIFHRCFAWELIHEIGFRKSIFPECVPSVQRTGTITKEAALLTGLPASLPVIAGGGDSLMQAVGNGAVKAGILTANIGTASQLCCTLEQPLCDTTYRTNTFCHVVRDRWMLQGSNLSGGISLKWLKNNILKQYDYDEMTRLAKQIPAGSEGLLFLPYLNGERTPVNDPDARGVFVGLSLQHEQAHLIRSVMEGIIFSMRHTLGVFEKMGIPVQGVIASGGGARGDLFRQIMADMFCQDVLVGKAEEQACLGAAITAAVGVGDFADFEEACQTMVHYQEQISKAILNHVKRYEELYQRYIRIYEQTRSLVK